MCASPSELQLQGRLALDCWQRDLSFSILLPLPCCSVCPLCFLLCLSLSLVWVVKWAGWCQNSRCFDCSTACPPTTEVSAPEKPCGTQQGKQATLHNLRTLKPSWLCFPLLSTAFAFYTLSLCSSTLWLFLQVFLSTFALLLKDEWDIHIRGSSVSHVATDFSGCQRYSLWKSIQIQSTQVWERPAVQPWKTNRSP